MSSFIRNVKNKKRKTGITILDKFLNTVENGTLFLIKEDEYSYLHNLLLNIFLSEGVHDNEKKILAVNKDGPIEIYDKIDKSDCTEQLSKMYIAWRYADLKSNNSDSKYSLTSRIDYNHGSILKEDATLFNILYRLNTTTDHRIALYSLFSPSYDVDDIDKWLYQIRRAIRMNGHICMMSIPTFFYDKVIFDQYFDVVMSLNSNIFNNVLPNYKAVIHFEKVSFPTRIRENDTDTFKFGIKFSKDRLVMEKIDIPPEDIVEPIKSCTSF